MIYTYESLHKPPVTILLVGLFDVKCVIQNTTETKA